MKESEQVGLIAALGKAESFRVIILDKFRKAVAGRELTWEFVAWLAGEAPIRVFSKMLSVALKAYQEYLSERQELKRMESMEWSRHFPCTEEDVTPERFGLDGVGWRLPTLTEILWGFRNNKGFHPYVIDEYLVEEDPDTKSSGKKKAISFPACTVQQVEKAYGCFACFVRDKAKPEPVEQGEDLTPVLG